ncbi:transglycosylase SLT domain-containing protein [Fluviicola sp.]|uniref:transglycosylase SLT domain-containing protein n=1 Tax=Fluviicola sp. TaxID=1917219 RepID=UPI0031D6BC67
MKRKTLLALLACIPFLSFSQNSDWEPEMISVTEGSSEHVIMGAAGIQAAQWDQLQHPKFWQQIMILSPDSVLVNVGSTRQIIAKMANKDWHAQTEAQKTLFKDSIRSLFGLNADERINVTTGKNDFYRFDLVFESLPQGVSAFEQFGVDPWYAQSILLIESPGRMQKSSVGAYGPFQLMPGVARSMGLTVNRTVDERKDFMRSAYAASQLLKRICIPSARGIAEGAGLTVDEHAIWFRLLTMHVYHAGALNVKAVVNAIGQVASGEELIQKMWVTSAASFGNASQNYSQLALAAHIQLAKMLSEKSASIYQCSAAWNMD